MNVVIGRKSWQPGDVRDGPTAGRVAPLAPPAAGLDKSLDDSHECCSEHARGERLHAAQLGAPLLVPDAAAIRGRAPAVRARADRGAAPGTRGDPQRLLRD